MAGAYVKSLGVSNSGTLTLSASAASGNTVFFTLMQNTGTVATGVTDTKGNTWVRDGNVQFAGGNCQISVWRTTQNAGTLVSGDVITPAGSNFVTMGADEVSGIQVPVALDGAVGTNTGNSTSLSTGSTGTLTNTDSFAVAAFGGDASQVITASSPFSGGSANNNGLPAGCFRFSYRALTATTAQTANATSGAAMNWGGVIVAYKTSGGGSSGGTATYTQAIRTDGRRVITFTSSGTWLVPDGVTSIMVEVRGSGGAGGVANVNAGGGGGGGGYSRQPSHAVTPGEFITLQLAGTASAAAGSASWWRTSSTIFANGGAVGGDGSLFSAGTAGAGAAAGSGGAGGVAYAGGTGSGATGGGSAGAGGAASGTAAGTGNSVSSAPNNGAGVAGAATNVNGTAPGGGGGGQGLLGTRGTGGAGAVIITYSITGGASESATGAAPGKKVQKQASGGTITPFAGFSGGTRKTQTDKNNGAFALHDAEGTKKVEKNASGGAYLPPDAEATKKLEVRKDSGGYLILAAQAGKKVDVTKANGAFALLDGEGSKKLDVRKDGGSYGSLDGEGSKKVEARRSGGSYAVFYGAASKKVEIRKDGLAYALLAAQASKKVEINKVLSGAAVAAYAYGDRKTVVIKSGGSYYLAYAQGSKKVEKRVTAGSYASLFGAGSKILTVRKDGGGYYFLVAGATKKLQVIKPLSGSYLTPYGFAMARPLVDKRANGGVMDEMTAGGDKKVQKDANGGSYASIHGDMLQYSLYTFGISGYTRDRYGTIVVASKVGLFRQDTWDRVAGPILSDPITGRYAFTTPSPASLPVSYFVRMQKNSYAGAGGENIFGTTDEDLYPVATLIQGTEIGP